MNNPVKLLLLVILIMGLLCSCSTISRKPISIASQKTREFLEQARKEELKQNYIDAMSIYSDAESNSILANELDLQLISLQGKARISYIHADSLAYAATLESMKQLVTDVRPDLFYRVIQINYWSAFYAKDYALIISKAPDVSQLPLNVRIEILSYLIQAKAQLNLGTSDDQALMKKALKRYYVRLNRKLVIQPELLSNAYYSLAYAYASESGYDEALKMLSKAIALDKGYDLYVQLADDFALAGKCELKRNNAIKAKAYLSLALQIYNETGQKNDIKAIETLIYDISRKK